MDPDILSDLPIENKEWLDDIKRPRGVIDTMAAPVSQLFSVKLHCDVFKQRDTCEVYGNINIEDVYGNTFELYDVDSDNPETITCVENNLDIYLPLDCAASYKWARMVIRLFDRADDSSIVDNVLNFDTVDIGDFDRLKNKHVDGARGRALVSFVTFSKAVFALVEIKLCKNDKSSNALQAAPCLNGRIVARYGNTYGEKYPGIMLFNEPSDQSTKVEFDTPIELWCRDMVIVPAYSFFRIDFSLFDSLASKSLCNHKAEFLASNGNWPAWSNIEAGDFIVRVDVKWAHPYVVEVQSEDLSRRPKVSTYQQVCGLSREPYLPKFVPFGFPLLEVFTVMIGHNSSSDLNIRGTVRIRDIKKICLVFNREESNPQSLTPKSQTIPIEGPSECFSGPEGLVMELNLSDIYDEVFIRGTISWHRASMDLSAFWYNKRICSVCRGSKGYAAVFYTLFSRAVQASVQVSFFAKNSSDTSYHHVQGTILASYNTEEYSTEYEKTYYKSTLFNNNDDSFSQVKSGCRIPLQKSVVAVPVDASLMLEVDLNAKSAGEHWKNVVPIEIEDPNTNDTPISKWIKGKNYDMEISVVWSKLYHLFS